MLEKLETWIKERLRKALAIPPLENRVAQLETLTQQLKEDIEEIKVRLDAKEIFGKTYWDVGMPILEERIAQINREISNVKLAIDRDRVKEK